MKKLIGFWFIFASTTCTFGQSRFFTLTEGWKVSAVKEYTDSYICIGSVSLGNSSIKHIQFSRLDTLGQVDSSWVYKLDSITPTEMRNQQSFSTFNNNFMIGVTTIPPPGSILTARRLILNATLEEVIDTTWISPFTDAIMYVSTEVSENKILHATDHFNGNKVASVILETDTLGNTIWESSFLCTGSCWMEPRHIIPTNDGGYIFTNTESRLVGGTSVDNHDVATIIKVDSVGEQQWRIHPGGLGLPYTSEYILLQATDDGNYLCAWADNFWDVPYGNVSYQRNPDATIWFAKIDPAGNKLWEKNIQQELELWDVEDFFYNMEQMIRTTDSNFVFISDDRLFKINQEAEVIWARKLNPLGFESSPEQEFYLSCFGLNQVSDGGYICTGDLQIYSGDIYPEFIQTGFVLKLDEYGCYEAGCQEDDPVSVVSPQLSIKEMSIYPNPAQESVTLSYDIGQSASRVSFMVTDVTGRAVHQQALAGIAGTVQVDTQAWTSGVYLCRLMVGGHVGGVRRVVIY